MKLTRREYRGRGGPFQNCQIEASAVPLGQLLLLNDIVEEHSYHEFLASEKMNVVFNKCHVFTR